MVRWVINGFLTVSGTTTSFTALLLRLDRLVACWVSIFVLSAFVPEFLLSAMWWERFSKRPVGFRRPALDDASGQGWMNCRLAKVQRALGSADGVSYYLDEAEAIAAATGDTDLARECEALRQPSDTANKGG